MEFQLDDNTTEQEPLQEQETLADDDGYYHAPVRETPLPSSIPTKKQIHIPTFVFIIPIILIAIWATRFLPSGQKKSLNNVVHLPQANIETELGITLAQNPSFVSKLSIPNGKADGFQTYTTSKDDFSVIYYNGQQFGISFSSRNYSLYGVSIGDSEASVFKGIEHPYGVLLEDGNPAYAFSEHFNMLEDMSRGNSTATYFIGTDKSVLVLVFNDTTNRVVNIIYYYDAERILEDVSTL